MSTDWLPEDSQLKTMPQDLILNLGSDGRKLSELGWVILTFCVSVSLLAKYYLSCCDYLEVWCKLTENNHAHEVCNDESLGDILIFHPTEKPSLWGPLTMSESWICCLLYYFGSIQGKFRGLGLMHHFQMGLGRGVRESYVHWALIVSPWMWNIPHRLMCSKQLVPIWWCYFESLCKL